MTGISPTKFVDIPIFFESGAWFGSSEKNFEPFFGREAFIEFAICFVGFFEAAEFRDSLFHTRT